MPFNHAPAASSGTSAPAEPVSSPRAEDPSADGVAFSADRLRRDAKARDGVKNQDPGSLAQVEQQARAHLLRTLNGLRVIAPALRQAVDSASDEQQQAERFTTIMSRARDFALQGCAYVDLDPTLDMNRWALAMFERAFITAFAQGEVPEQVGEALFRSALDQAGERGQDSIVPDREEDTTVIRKALVRGLSHLIIEQSQFDFFRPDPAADIQAMAQLLTDSAEQVMVSHVQPLTADLERQSLLAGLVEEGGRLLAQAWRQEAVKAKASMRSSLPSKDAMERWKRANTTGLPLDNVIKVFRLQMARLSQLMKVPRPRR